MRMELNQLYKIVYSDNDLTKVTKGILRNEDEFTLTIEVTSGKFLTIGKRYLQKATNIVGGLNE